MQNEKNDVEKVLESAIKNFDGLIKTEKIVGESIVNEKGQKVVPVSTITTGVVCGGGEYGSVKVIKTSGENFAGGAASVSLVKPECFLIDNGDGWSVINQKGEGLEALLKTLAEFIKRLK